MRRIVLAVAALVAVAVTAAPARADLDDDLDAARGRADALRELVEGAEAERSALASSILDTGSRLDVLSAELAEAGAALAETEAEMAVTRAAIDDLGGTIERRQVRVVELQSRVAATRIAALERAVELYMSVDGSGVVPVVEDIQVAAVGTVYAERIQALAREDIARFEALRSSEETAVRELAAAITARQEHAAVLERQRVARQERADEVAARTSEVRALLAEQERLLASLDDEISHFEGEIAALEREQAQLEALIREQQSSGGSAPEGELFRPVPGAISSGYGPRVHPIYGSVLLHTGADMNAACGDAIRAAEAGRVFLADWRGGYGLTVMIDHGGGMSTLYAHQTQTAVVYGQSVTRGEVIGYIGSTGTSTACHLHFEVRLGDTPVDPAPYL